MKKVCFVCLGNICRSPMAEFVMKHLDKKQELWVESRATSTWEHGNPIHLGTQKIFQKYAIAYDKGKVSQSISQSDFGTFDLIIGMDEQNVRDLRMFSNGRYDDKIALFCDGGVPDPWYTGDFEETYHLVTTGCAQWLNKILGE
ncbi:low molecular weight protein-tyrosine-phosphatase [uncultured Streptococcus sp.]|uniref:low molecular weight protein-tyrosine-phosphatase n=1 Tax=uncultured Streptococcus sp. TaxID=83427 RepID=UPI0027DCDE6B|nr:low molecular weight protein-tyrosine-phosphatase [uncultured Streptococcus sp.]